MPALLVQGLFACGEGAVVEGPDQAEGIGCRYLACDASPKGSAKAVGVFLAVEHIGSRGEAATVACVVKFAGTTASKGVFTHNAEHCPGGYACALEGHGNGERKEVHVVQIVGRPVCCSFKVVVEGTGPEGSDAKVVVYGHVHGNTRHITVKDLRGLGRVVRKVYALQAHAGLDLGARYGPVHVGALDFHDGSVTAKGATLACPAPGKGSHFEVDRAREVFRGYRVQLQAHTGLGLELVLAPASPARDVSSLAILLDEIAASAIFKHGNPDALGLELYGLGTACHSKNQTRSQQKGCEPFFHTFSSKTVLVG